MLGSREGRLIVATVVCVVLGAIGLIVTLGPHQLSEVTETVARGRLGTVDEAGLTPIRGRERLILICLDGVGYEVLNDVIAEGRMPRLGEILGEQTDEELYATAWSIPDVLSVLPSTTLAAWTSVFTGVPVAQHGVSGNEQLNRDTRRFYAPAPVSVSSIEDMMDTMNDDLTGEMIRVPTLYERLPPLRSHVSLAHVQRGSDLFTVPGGADVASIFAAFVEGAATGRHEAASRLEGARALDEQSIDAVLAAVEEHGVPDLQVLYFPGIDLYTHAVDRPLVHQERFLNEVIDPALGRVFDRWEEAGVLQDTWIVLVSDHGHTPVANDDHHSLDVGEEDEPTHILEELGFVMRPYEVGVAGGPWSAAVAYQGAFAYVYLADRSTCGEESCDWDGPPRLDEEVLPVARAFFDASRDGSDVPALEGAIDLVFAREPVAAGELANPYQIWDGEALVPVSTYLEAHPRPELLALASRLEGLSAGRYGHTAGDVLLMARTGGDIPFTDRYYFSGPYHSWHGSPARSDSHIPFVVAHGGTSGEAIRARVAPVLGPLVEGWHSQVDVTPVVIDLLSEPAGGGGGER